MAIHSVLKRPLLKLSLASGMKKFTSPKFELDWLPPTVDLGSERPADFVRLFNLYLWDMVQCSGNTYLTQLINDEGAYRTAPATPGLLNIYYQSNLIKKIKIICKIPRAAEI